MAAILGGALLVWWLGVRRDRADASVVVGVAERYEWIFWAAIGLQVMTGVGNLGAFGDALPSPSSAWGTKLIVKLVAVLALAVLSVPRTLAVVAMAGDKQPRPGLLSALYGGTAAVVVGIVGLAVWLAHG
jgi:putative copper export protein